MSTSPPSDRELLRRFHEHRNEVAFTELYQRYAPLVFAVCRRVLRDPHLAEDATSAAFLVLAKEAGTVSRDARPLGAWLHRVATNIARNVWRSEGRRRVREQAAGAAATSQPDAAATAELQCAQLHLELERLPEKYRAAIVLHHLEGRSYEEAAAALGCNRGVFGVRLARAREMLRKRVVARGIALGTGDVTGVFAEERATSVALPAALAAATCRAASLVAAGKTLTGTGLVSAKVAYLTRSALKTLFWAKVKTAAAVVVLTAGVAAGIGLAVHHVLANRAAPLAARAGETAVANAAARKKLSPEDAWWSEVLARAEAAPCEVAALERGALSGPGVWLTDVQTGNPEPRIWQTNPKAGQSLVLLDTAKCKRGVVVGRVMLLPEGMLPSSLAVPKGAMPFARDTGRLSIRQRDAKNAVYVVLYKGPVGVDQPKQMFFFELLDPERVSKGAWFHFLVYVDLEDPGATGVLSALWPAGGSMPSPPPNMMAHQDPHRPLQDQAVGLGLATKGAAALWQGLKFVPLGQDMPRPPSRLWQPSPRE